MRIRLLLETWQSDIPMSHTSCVGASSTASGRIGKCRRRVPEAAKIAFPIAGATTGLWNRVSAPRERQTPAPAEIVAGTFAYMSPDQTGRMDRSMDARSDVDSLCVTLYQILTGALPFAAADPSFSAHDIICHRLSRHVRGEWAHRFPLNSSESHIPDALVPRSFMERIPTPA
jgi:serine/threonine protein kinase